MHDTCDLICVKVAERIITLLHHLEVLLFHDVPQNKSVDENLISQRPHRIILSIYVSKTSRNRKLDKIGMTEMILSDIRDMSVY